MIHDAEKNLDEFKDQLNDEQAAELRAKIAETREVMEKEGADAEEIRKASSDLQAASLNTFEEAYKKKSSENDDSAKSTSDDDKKKSADDADFEDVNSKKDEKK